MIVAAWGWGIVGLFEIGFGFAMLVGPAIGERLFSFKYHDRSAERFPRWYRFVGWPAIRGNREFVIRGIGASLIFIGVITAVVSWT